MVITELADVGIGELLGYSPQYAERSPGLHLSAIVRDLSAVLDPQRFGKAGGDPHAAKPPRRQDGIGGQAMLELGMALEEVLSQALMARALKWGPGQHQWSTARKSRAIKDSGVPVVRPGEFHLQGITGTPDAIRVIDWSVEEWKLTWMSMGHPPESGKFWHWWVQLMAYCKMVGSSRGRIRAMFVNGNYRDQSGPHLRNWEAEFSTRDLDDNWAMIFRHARDRKWL